jgi:hypothetical protein
MGDSLGDLHMAEGIPNPNVILKIGFLNRNIEENLIKYKVSDFLEFIQVVPVPVLPTGRNFCSKTLKWPHKNLSGRENPRPNFLQICQKMAEKGLNLFGVLFHIKS